MTDGEICLGGNRIKDIPLEQINRQIAYVSQDNYLFDRTIRENIRMGRLDAPIVILDEATASIDPENEAMIQKAISALTKGKTLIVIAHRLGTIADADKIVVVEDGKIAAQGTGKELLANCPLYAKMWEAYLGVRDVA